jgi:hypothetical protein
MVQRCYDHPVINVRVGFLSDKKWFIVPYFSNALVDVRRKGWDMEHLCASCSWFSVFLQ